MPYVNGTYFSQPGPVIQINDSAMVQNLSNAANGLLLLGSSTDGEPQNVYTFTSPSSAIATLKGGPLLQATLNAFNPSPIIPGAPFISCIRVDEAGGTLAGNTILNATTGTCITLTPTSYGAAANSLKWMLSTGTLQGYQFSMANDLSPVAGGLVLPTFTLNNIALYGITVYYSGVGTVPTYTVTSTSISFSATVSGTPTVLATITFTSTMTIQALVNQINQNADLVAAVADPNPNDLVSSLFDIVATAPLGTTSTAATSVTANATAIVRAINAASGGYFTAVKSPTATIPATTSTWTYISGATTTAPQNTDWQSAYTFAQTLNNIYAVTPVINTYAIWSMNDAHCQYMQSIGLPRRGYVGDSVGQLLSVETAFASTLNSNRTSIVWPGATGFDYNGNATTFAPYYVAAMMASMRCGAAPTRALTNTQLNVTGLETQVTPQTVATALTGGVDVLYPNFKNQVTVAHDITTWLSSTAIDKVENNVGMEVDVIYQDLWNLFSTYIGLPDDSTVQANLSATTLDRLTYWYEQGYLAASPSASNINLTFSGTIITGSINIAITSPINYISVQFNLTSQ